MPLRLVVCCCFVFLLLQLYACVYWHPRALSIDHLEALRMFLKPAGFGFKVSQLAPACCQPGVLLLWS